MIGAIIGDVVGSRFERKNNRSKDFELFTDECFFTDDTVMTLAVAKAFINCQENYEELDQKAIYSMRDFGCLYPYCNYGSLFMRWLLSKKPTPYRSYGSGAAMRVSACAHVAKTLDEANAFSKTVTEITHNHKEGIKGAEAVTSAIFLAVNGYSKDSIRDYISKKYYRMNFKLDSIRHSPFYLEETCQDTVPYAIMSFLDSTDFEDAIRNAVSLGGDSDTIAAITGSIAEAYYGVPKELEEKALSYLDEYLLEVVNCFKSLFLDKTMN